MLVLLIVIILLFGLGGSGAYYGRQNWGNVGGIVPLILVVVVLFWLFGGGGYHAFYR